MASGFLSGLVVGAVVSGAALSAVSLATAPGRVAAPEAAELDVPAGSEFNQSRDDTAARLPDAEAAPEIAGEAPQVDAAAPDDLSAVSGVGTQPSTRPQPGSVDANLSAPQVVDEGSGMAMGVGSDEIEDPSIDAAESAGRVAQNGDMSISADPAQPDLPETEDSAGMSAVAGVSLDDAEATPEAETEGEAQPETEPAPEAVTLEADAPDEPAQSSTITDLADGIETKRLPSVGVPQDDAAADDTADDAPDASSAEADASDTAAGPDTRPAIARFAEPFSNPDGKPLMSIVLMHDGGSPIGLDALDAFPYPLSFAVDASEPGAGAAMKSYRDAGFEVLAIADLPESADARDTETVMQTVFDAVPEAVAVLEGTGTGLQISRDASEQLAPILLETGHGLVVFSKGLETAPKLIAREGVPVGTIFRDFDSNDQSATVIRRFLDQAAFKAGRDEGGVIMLGRLRADTISALLLWGLQDRANRVALAPISAVLTSTD